MRLLIVGACAALMTSANMVTASDELCSPVINYVPQRAGTLAVLARPTRDTVPVGSAYGQVFEVLAVSNRGSPYRVFPGEQIVAVPQAYRADCGITPWTSSARWVPLEEAVVFSELDATYDPSSRPIQFLVRGWHRPYPTSDLIRYHPPVLQRDAPWLSAHELYELIAALPTMPERGESRDAVIASYQEWESQHPDLADHFPATDVAYWLEWGDGPL